MLVEKRLLLYDWMNRGFHFFVTFAHSYSNKCEPWLFQSIQLWSTRDVTCALISYIVCSKSGTNVCGMVPKIYSMFNDDKLQTNCLAEHKNILWMVIQLNKPSGEREGESERKNDVCISCLCACIFRFSFQNPIKNAAIFLQCKRLIQYIFTVQLAFRKEKRRRRTSEYRTKFLNHVCYTISRAMEWLLQFYKYS